MYRGYAYLKVMLSGKSGPAVAEKSPPSAVEIFPEVPTTTRSLLLLLLLPPPPPPLLPPPLE